MGCNEGSLYNISWLMGDEIHDLYSLATWRNGLPFKKIDFTPTGLPVIKIAELNNGISAGTSYTSGVYSPDVFMTKGDYAFSWSGNPQTSIDIFKYDLPDGWLNQHIFKVTPNESLVDRTFFFFLMKALKPIFSAIATNKQTTGLGHITVADMKRIKVAIPPQKTQSRIAFVLGDIQNEIDNLNRTNGYLAALCEAQLTKLTQDKSASATVEDYCQLIYSGGTPSTKRSDYWNGNIPWLSSGETRDLFIVGTEKKITNQGVLNSSTKLALNGDVVMASAGQGLTRGQTSMLLLDTYVNQSVVVMRPKVGCGPYLLFQLHGSYAALRAWSDSASSRGSMSGKLLRSFALPKLQDTEITAFNAFCQPIIASIGENKRQVDTLVQLRDTLLPKLMSGEIDVSKVELPTPPNSHLCE